MPVDDQKIGELIGTVAGLSQSFATMQQAQERSQPEITNRTKLIHLTQGKYTIIDQNDYDWLMQWKWYCSNTGYAIRSQHISYINGKSKGKTISMHRVIMNTPDDMGTDHQDGDRLNNRRCNLRICTKSQNMMNSKKPSHAVHSRHKGVTWHKENQKWMAQIRLNKVKYYLGCFHSETAAAIAYNEAAKELHGDFAARSNLCL